MIKVSTVNLEVSGCRRALGPLRDITARPIGPVDNINGHQQSARPGNQSAAS